MTDTYDVKYRLETALGLNETGRQRLTINEGVI